MGDNELGDGLLNDLVDLQDNLAKHYRQLAPHAKERRGAELIEQAIVVIGRVLSSNRGAGRGRQTGRTSTLLMQGYDKARRGTPVLIVAAGYDHRRTLVGQLANLTGYKVDGPAAKLPLRIEAAESVTDMIDWRTLRNLERTQEEVMVDHHTLEREFAAVLRELERYG